VACDWTIDCVQDLSLNYVCSYNFPLMLLVSNDFRLGSNPDQLAAVAYSRLQKELARDGREPGYVSNGGHNKSISQRRSGAGPAAKTKGKKI